MRRTVLSIPGTLIYIVLLRRVGCLKVAVPDDASNLFKNGRMLKPAPAPAPYIAVTSHF